MIPVFESERAAIVQADCVAYLRTLPDASVDAVVTDPPYELGFMGKSWDNKGIAFSVDLWREVLRVLKPGGYLASFGGTRTYHRMTCAIEDAGFEVRDCLAWMYGTGFPKSLNLGDGRGTALKPAFEPIVLARKPLGGTVAANVAAHGTGALNIDACRIATDDALVRPPIQRNDNAVLGRGLGAGTQVEPAGRWPANVVLDEAAAAILDAQTGTLTSGKVTRDYSATTETSVAMGTKRRNLNPDAVYSDAGGASRFFYVAKAARSEREVGCDALPVRSGAEAVDREEGSAGTRSPRAGAGRSASEVRNHHPTVKPVALMRWLIRLVTPPGGLVLDPFVGSGTTAVAAVHEGFNVIGVEREAEYAAIASARVAHAVESTTLDTVA